MQRVPIKIRKPIHKDYCTCHDVRVLSVDGTPELLMADKLSSDGLSRFLESHDVCTAICLQNATEEHVSIAKSHGLPVVVFADAPLNKWVIPALAEIPDSAVHFSIRFPNDFIRSRLSPKSFSVSDLCPTMALAKSNKIFVAIQMEYNPALVSKLDLYEVIEQIKNYASHILIHFPEVLDDELQANKSSWESLVPSSIERFKKVYEADVQGRKWVVKAKYKKEFISNLQDFIKSKRLGLELYGDWESPSRVRQASSDDLEDNVMGLSRGLYHKIAGKFVRAYGGDEVEETPCSKCGLTLFV